MTMDYMKGIDESIKGLERRVITPIGEMQIKLRELADDMLQMKQRGMHMPAGPSGDGFGLGVAGNGFYGKIKKAFADNADLIAKSPNVRIEVKAAGDALTTPSARSVESAGVGVPAGMPLGVQNGISTRVIGPISAIEYSRFLAVEGAAAKQSAEGAAKAAVRPTFSLITETAATIAGYSKISKQALTDSEELRRAIDVTLRRSIGAATDTLLNSGTWGGAAGLLAHSTAYTSLVYTALVDAISEGVATMQTAGFVPDTVVMTPADWLSIVTAKASGSGEYLSGAYLSALPEAMRGLRVVLSPTVTAGKGMVIDSSQIEMLICEDLTIEIGTDGNDFTTNVRTILGEMRVIPTFRAVGAARLITPKA
jgi:hypothetical protein